MKAPEPATDSAVRAEAAEAVGTVADSPGIRPTSRTLVVGAGAVGSLLGALLGSVGHDVSLVRISSPIPNGRSLWSAPMARESPYRSTDLQEQKTPWLRI